VAPAREWEDEFRRESSIALNSRQTGLRVRQVKAGSGKRHKGLEEAMEVPGKKSWGSK
jgi:hypothetical protein